MQVRRLKFARMTPKFFPNAAAFRRWLGTHHARAAQLVVGFYKRDSGRASLSWPESVEEALCFGWIDGVRRRLDALSYQVRFTPRRAGSIWSAVNIRKVAALRAAGRMQPAGLEAFRARRARRSGRYSYEQRPTRLPEPHARLLRADAAALRFFTAQIPSYRRAAIWWVISAQRPQTRARRAALLVELSAAGQLIPQFVRGTRPKPLRGARPSTPRR
jgi:uncharacterized protein YdeI (YjbR/CyaY-like superfamily)